MPVKDQEYQWHDRVHGNVKCDASVIWVKEGPDPFHRFLRTPLLSARQKLELSLNITTHDSQAERSLVQILKHLKHRELHKVFSPPFLEARSKHCFWAQPPSPLTDLFWWSNLSSVSQATQPVLTFPECCSLEMRNQGREGCNTPL